MKSVNQIVNGLTERSLKTSAASSRKDEEQKLRVWMMTAASRASFTDADQEEAFAFWEKMEELFGKKWTSQNGAAPVENGEFTANGRAWMRKLKTISGAQFRRSIEAMAHKFRCDQAAGKESWPPTPMEFWVIATDTTAVDWEQKRMMPSRPAIEQKPVELLEDERLVFVGPPAPRKTAQDYMAEIRRTLGMKERNDD